MSKQTKKGNFTSHDIQGNKQLIGFIGSNVTTERKGYTTIEDNLYAIFSIKEVVKVLEKKIKLHTTTSHLKHYIPLWEKHIAVLKALNPSLFPKKVENAKTP